MVVQEGVEGSLQANDAAWELNHLSHRAPLLGVAANAGTSSVPCGRDSPSPAVVHKLSPQQIGHLLR
jgi:hypothetical protein